MSTATVTAPLLLLSPPIPLRSPEPVLPLTADPEQPAWQEFTLLRAWLSSAPVLALPLHQVESQQLPRGREVERLLFQAHIQLRGHGDVGAALRVRQANQQVLYTHRRLCCRSLQTIFGPVEITRMGYSGAGTHSLYPLDEMLQLPARSFSYELQKRLVKAAVQGPFQESIDAVAELTGSLVAKRSLEQILPEAAQDVDAFYAERAPEPESGSILVAAVDAKGIPMVKPGQARRTSRLAQGEKANRKRMATVAAVFSRSPWVRTPEQVVESLFGTRAEQPTGEPPPPRPENKRVWASLVKSKSSVIAEVAQEIHRRDPEHQKTQVALSDGERALQLRLERTLKVPLILDLLHVLEKLWKAAHVFHPEGSLEAQCWVQQRTLRILRGEVSQVVKGIRQSVTKLHLYGAKRKRLRGVASYLFHNRGRMRYHQYLAQGLPIASGPVEGACKNLIKDRMERSGMRWTEAMAEAIVKLRAVYLSGHFDAYWSFHLQRDQQRLHPAGLWSVVAK